MNNIMGVAPTNVEEAIQLDAYRRTKQYNPTPEPLIRVKSEGWAKDDRNLYLNNYRLLYVELTDKATWQDLAGWGAGVALGCLTVLAVTAITILGIKFASTAATIIFTASAVIVTVAMGFTLSAIIGLWISSRGEQYLIQRQNLDYMVRQGINL